MAVEGIDIDVRYVANMASQIQKISADIDESLTAIENEMKNLSTIWQSRAQTSLNEKFTSIGEKREKFCHDLNEYAKYLENVATEYGYTETEINRNAESFE